MLKLKQLINTLYLFKKLTLTILKLYNQLKLLNNQKT